MNENQMTMEIRVPEKKKVQDDDKISKKEQELIRQLVEVRMKKNKELEYESLDGYVVPPKTYFSMLKKPAVSIKPTKLEFNMSCIRLFEGVQYILPIFNAAKKRLAIVMCAEEEMSSVEWARRKGDSWTNKSISSPEYLGDIFRVMSWDLKCRYKAIGRIANSERGVILIFDLEDAIMFDPLPEEYIDKKTGKMKKRINRYFPDEIRNNIGRSYADYAAKQKASGFESLTNYSDSHGQNVDANVDEDEAMMISNTEQERSREELLDRLIGGVQNEGI